MALCVKIYAFVDPVHDRTAQEAEEEHRQELSAVV